MFEITETPKALQATATALGISIVTGIIASSASATSRSGGCG